MEPTKPTTWDYTPLLQATGKVGIAARVVDRWGQDWHKHGWDADTYRRVHNDILDMADAIDDLQNQAEKYVQKNDHLHSTCTEFAERIHELEQQLAALAQHDGATGGEWVAVEDGVLNEENGIVAKLSEGGSYFEVSNDKDGKSIFVRFKTEKYRLCKRVEPAAAPVPTPAKVEETIREALLERKQRYREFHYNTEWPVYAKWLEEIEAALSWLKQQRQGSE